jgi:D-alanine-D-alanine ligase-like ATP-grasp enzyme
MASGSSPWSRTNQLLVAAAARLGVLGSPLASEHSDFFMRLTWPDAPEGPRTVIVSKTRSPFLTEVAQTLANNKFISRELLAARGLPVIRGVLFDEADDLSIDGRAAERARALLAAHTRVVVKPNWGNRGLGIVTDVVGFDQLRAAIEFARGHDRDEEAVVEPFVAGINIRVAVIGGRVAAAAEVGRPQLRGDGQRTGAQLLDQLNADARRGSWARPSLVPLDQIDPEMVAERLAVAGYGLGDRLPAGVCVELCFEELEVIDRSDALDPSWAAIAIEAATALGIDVAGVDLRGPADVLLRPVAPSQSPVGSGAPTGTPAGVLEVNALPALHLHALPTAGSPRPVFDEFVAYCLQLPGAPPVCARVCV